MSRRSRRTSSPRARFSPHYLTVLPGSRHRAEATPQPTAGTTVTFDAVATSPQPETELWFGEVLERSGFINGVFVTKITCDGMSCNLLISGPDLGMPGTDVELEIIEDDIVGARIADRPTFYKATAATTR